jgi:hypothetical protein
MSDEDRLSQHVEDERPIAAGAEPAPKPPAMLINPTLVLA